MVTTPTHTQNPLRPGIIELAYGEPAPELLPSRLVREAAAAVLDGDGPAALAYGHMEGPLELREAIAGRVTAREGCDTHADDIIVSAGNSQALDLVLTRLAEPDDAVLVESPTFNLALRTLRDHPLEIVGVPLNDGGLDVDHLARTLSGLHAAERRARLLYTIPTYHNPGGVCLAHERRARLLDLAREHDLVVVEDDVYRELGYDGAVPPALWAGDPTAPVVRLGSFSKTLAPGLRVGWINAPADLRERLAGAGVLESGGCPSQFTATVVAQVLAQGGYDDHIAKLRRAYASRRDALVAALGEHLPAGCRFSEPAGGFFVWVTLPEGMTASSLLPLAEARGVAFAPGARFCSDGADQGLRLAFSLYDGASLREGARRLAAAIATAAQSA